MYISNEKIHALDVPVKDFEVALRGFVADVMLRTYPSRSDYEHEISNVNFGPGYIFSKKLNSKVGRLKANKTATYDWLIACRSSFQNRTCASEAPYVSELIDLILIFFDAAFSGMRLAEKFSSVDDFYYSCIQYHKVRNSLSHPATNPIQEVDALRVLNFIESLSAVMDSKYFWYQQRGDIIKSISKYKEVEVGGKLKASNIEYARLSHKGLFCRDDVLKELYTSVAGEGRRRLAGSYVLYGYGGVGKTAIVTEFLLRLQKDKLDGLYDDIEFLLFYSSKDEYLRTSQTTGGLYIDRDRPEFSTLDGLKSLILKSLSIDSLDDVERNYRRGIIVIDNFENIESVERQRIIEFTKDVPRSVQFILTSRNEENCEEKSHVRGFSDLDVGVRFIKGLLEEQEDELLLTDEQLRGLVSVSTGNALVIIQILSSLQNKTSTFEAAMAQIENMNSRNSEAIASFMFKNTFDSVVLDAESIGLPAKKVLQYFSLYGEALELYSISKLAKISVSDAETLCEMLLSRIVIVKRGEYYEMNEFARRFIHLSLLTDRVEESRLKSAIKTHKENVARRLDKFNSILSRDKNLKRIVAEWQPRTYIDNMIISELFLIYQLAQDLCKRRDRPGYEIKLAEIEDCVAISGHPYVSFQKARVLRLGLERLSISDKDYTLRIVKSYEMALEAILYDYRYLDGTPAHSSLLVVFGAFLTSTCREHGRAIRFLEDASLQMGDGELDRKWYLCQIYLARACYEQFRKQDDVTYKQKMNKAIEKLRSKREVLLRQKIRMFEYDRFISKIG